MQSNKLCLKMNETIYKRYRDGRSQPHSNRIKLKTNTNLSVIGSLDLTWMNLSHGI